MIVLRVILNLILVAFLTIISQIGGVVYLIFLPFRKITDKWTANRKQKYLYRFLTFLGIYLLAVFLIVPPIAGKFGMVQMPLFEQNSIKPYTVFTFLLNRNYVTPNLKQTVTKVAQQLNRTYPDVTISYLDANFPFNTGLPLFPHVSHKDGKKLDISFFYKDIETGEIIYGRPSFLGYGYVEGPRKNERNTPLECERGGNWAYSLLNKLPWIYPKSAIEFDEKINKKMIELFGQHKLISKIFIEPHLKARLRLNSSKVRFHGCKSVRHDDHLHVQIY